jgi:hypothetical protein
MTTYSIIARDPYNEQPMADPIGTLPVDAARIILRDLKVYLPDVAVVCSCWRNLVDDDDFRNMIRPAKAYGSREWKYYMGVDAGDEPRLPRCAYRDMESGNFLLTFIPNTVKLMLKNKYTLAIKLNNLKLIQKLVANPKNGNKIAFTEEPSHNILNSKRKLEHSHWVLLNTKFHDCGTYDKNLEHAREVNIKTPDTKISGLIDTVISVCMEFIRYGKRHPFHEPATQEYSYIHCNEQIKGKKICFVFRYSGLRFCLGGSAPNLPDGVGFLWAKKSF